MTIKTMFLKIKLNCLLAVLLGYGLMQPALLLAASPDQADASLATLEFRYHLPEATEVFLIWGINGWQVAPEAQRPAGTVVDGVMHTPMKLEDDTFVAKVSVPAGTTLDYGFQIRQKRTGPLDEWVWDGDYRLIVSKNDVIEVKAAVTLADQASNNVAETQLVAQEIRYHLPEAGEVFLVWGINGWQVAPEEQRPAGTLVKNKVMHTPMVREGDTFMAKVWAPAGVTADYGFLITKARSGAVIWIWDADGERDYHTIVRSGDVIEVRGSPSAVNQITKSGFKSAWLGFILLAGCGTIFGAAVLHRRFLTTASRSNHFLLDIQHLIWQKRISLIISFVFILYLIAINPDLYLWEDNAHYIIVGKSIATGQGFRDINYPDKPLFKYPIPMFPLMLAPIIYFFDYNLWPMKIFVAVIGVGVVYLIYRFFRDLLDETHAILLTLLVAVSPQLVSFSHQVMTEIPYLFLFLLALLSIKKYGTEKEWLTKMGMVSALVVTATYLTKSIGISLVLAAITYLLLDSSTDKLQAIKKISLLILVSGAMWLFLNYSVLSVNPYTGEFLKASPYSSDSTQAGLKDFVARITANINVYVEILPETILYSTYQTPFRLFTLFSVLVVGYGFLYTLVKKRTILEHYLCFYAAILLFYEPINLGNLQRYLVPIIPLILYYFMQGFNQITVRISDFTNSRLDYSTLDNPQPALESAFRLARTISMAVICTLILFNFASTLQASVLKTEPEMFDYYRLDNGFKAYRDMALWTKEHTSPDSIIITRRTFLYHVWSHRTVVWYPYVEAQANKEQIVQALLVKNADYIALDTLDVVRSASDQLIMDIVQQSPDSFELIYQDGENKLYRIYPEVQLSQQE